jgi:gliding motility-associated-like protein
MTIPGALDNKYFFGFVTGLILAFFFVPDMDAQITSSAADHVDTLSYMPGNLAEDPLFVFYQTDQVHKPGSLTASYPAAGNFNFDWSRYNPLLGGFDPPFSSETGASSSIADLEEGGYQVRIWNGSGTDTTLMSWVMLDHFSNSIAQTPEGNLPSFLYTCDFVGLAGYVFTDTLVYYDLLTNEAINRILDYGFKWTSDNADLDIPNDTIVLRPNISYKPPYKDTEYTLTATDEFGMTATDEVFYASIQTKAEFSMEYLDKITGEFDPDLDGTFDPDGETGSQDARLTVRFLNASLNGARYEWVYLDTVGGIIEEETTYELEAITEYTYEAAHKYYYPYMLSISEESCTDTFRLLDPIHVVPSQLSIPNVFSPNGDLINDFFVFKHQSLKSCQVTIVDRTGKVVYKRKIDDIYAWDGWDGNLRESSRRAPEGQYYFVVEALGYDGKEYQDPNIIEQRKLNRGSNGSGNTSTPPPDGSGTVEASDNLYTGWLYLYRHKGTF